MTATITENYDAEVSADDFLTADEPPDPDVPAGEDDAPYGWTRDRENGQLRPKKRPGRPGKPPGAEEIAAGPPVARADDRPPGPGKRGRSRGVPVADADVPMPKGGVIAAGVNKAYRRIGKIARAFDHDFGEAIIACTRHEEGDDADELTVGEGWENLCKTNPRVRRAVLKAIAGGAVGDLFMAHAPIGVALMMKPMVQRLIPLRRLVESMAEPDEDTPEGEGSADTGGMTPSDFEDMRRMAEQQAQKMAERMGMDVTPEQMAEASAQAAQQMPPAFRAQPRNQTRAKRRAGR